MLLIRHKITVAAVFGSAIVGSLQFNVMLVLRRFQRVPTVSVLEQTIKTNNVYPSTPEFYYIYTQRQKLSIT